MAKLSARGRTELCRYQKESELQPKASYDPIRERMTFAFMSDGHLLWQSKTWWSDGHQHLSQWHDKGKRTTEQMALSIATLESKGYLKV